LIIVLSGLLSSVISQKVPSPRNLIIPTASITSNTLTLLWDKPIQYNDITAYQIFKDGKYAGTSAKTNFTITDLASWKIYSISIKAQNKEGKLSDALGFIKCKTKPAGKIFNILDYGAKGDGKTKNTAAIQKAIDACSTGGTVLIPAGVFISGALFLKSNMTLNIAEGGTLKGSTEVQDYYPLILNRFEGWEMKTLASLLNAGTLSRNGKYNVSNLSIRGKGTIYGGGSTLGEAMIKAYGIRGRGRLICIMNGQNIDIQGLRIENPPCWTIHYIYSNNVVCRDLNIITKGIRNGDGIDPDSSTDCYIFNCTFDTGDDCIAIKSGKNPEGYFVAKPTKNVRITDCDFIRGHGISIGSEMSGGVEGVLVQDCKAGALLHGMQIKGTKERGGYVKNVTVADCQMLQITIFSELNYNNDGDPAPEEPIFDNFIFKNIDLSAASIKEPVININGFKSTGHRLRNVTFENITLPENAKVVINDAEKVKFTDVRSGSGAKPQYVIATSNDINY